MEDFDGATQAEHQDELWLVSYADLLTLLLGFFVLIVASVPLKQARFERIASAISGQKLAPLETLRTQVETLLAQSPELRESVRVRDDAEGLGIELRDALLFDSGSAQVRPDGLAAISRVATLLGALPARPIHVEGHTDDVPIHNGAFASNWELSSQRAINVLNALEQHGLARARMSARAFADTRPMPGAGAEAELEQQRLANRRVLIRVE
jgi:chemotaxis protein MotB